MGFATVFHKKRKDRLAGAAFGGEQVAISAVAVHVLEVDAHGGVGIVEHVAFELAARSLELRGGMRADALAKAR